MGGGDGGARGPRAGLQLLLVGSGCGAVQGLHKVSTDTEALLQVISGHGISTSGSRSHSSTSSFYVPDLVLAPDLFLDPDLVPSLVLVPFIDVVPSLLFLHMILLPAPNLVRSP